MRQKELFTKVQHADPAHETAVNAKLLTRAGFISKVMAGVYEYLPLGLMSLNKINAIIREEMNAIGAQELFLSALQDKEAWMKTGRWESARDVMYQFKDVGGRDIGLGWTHEEPLTKIALQYIHSYKDLPKAVYQIQTKFRNESRAKSGILRGREFLMKDLYSFHRDEKDLDRFYEKVAEAYEKIFRRVGLHARRTKASGGLFSEFSDEFQVRAEVGEDTLVWCTQCSFSANKDVASRLGLKNVCPECGTEVNDVRAIEVGNIFKLGTKFSEVFGLQYRDEKGKEHPVVMASYGIGPGRVMGTIVETHYDEHGIIWPESVAPFLVHLIELEGGDASKLYLALKKQGIEVLYDDRDMRSGEKFAEADLIGIPFRVVSSARTKNNFELKKRGKDDTVAVSEDKLFSILQDVKGAI